MKPESLNTDNLLTENVSRDILYIIRYLLSLSISSSRVKNKRMMRTYLQILKVTMKEHGELIMRHLLRYGACTPFELYESYGINYSTICRILDLLVTGEIIRQVGYVGRPYYNMGDGRPVKVYVLIDADPSGGAEAQKRYGEIQASKRGDVLRQADLDEAFNVVKLYLDKHEDRRIPEQQLVLRLLREEEIKGIEYPLLVRRLIQEGYEL